MSDFINGEYKPESKKDKLERLLQPDRIDAVQLPVEFSDGELEAAKKIADSDLIEKEKVLRARKCTSCQGDIGHIGKDARCRPCQSREYDEKFKKDLDAFSRRNYRESL